MSTLNLSKQQCHLLMAICNNYNSNIIKGFIERVEHFCVIFLKEDYVYAPAFLKYFYDGIIERQIL